MSAATKRKHVAKEIIGEFPPFPNPPRLFIARIISGRGNNLHLVEAALSPILIASTTTIDDQNANEKHDSPTISSSEIPSSTSVNSTSISTTTTTALPQFLVSMPVKFRKNFWVKRGDFVLCTPIDEGDKVKAEIARLLYKDDLRYYRQEGVWPKELDVGETGDGENRGKEEDDDDMFPHSDEGEEDDEEEEDEDIDGYGNDRDPETNRLETYRTIEKSTVERID